MDIERERRALELFETLIDCPVLERERRLTEACGSDVALVTSVRKLLLADLSLTAIMPTEISLAGFAEEPLPAPPPARVGAYRVIRLLGHGGMGDVYLGERDDGLFEQRVAIKFIRPGVMGLASVARLAEEPRIMARLRHPNIARIFDAGFEPEGRFYLILEWIEGRNLLAFADAESLSLLRRLALFREICAAVHYAHQNLIVHADLKPSNILVTPEGMPKLLDFGISKLVEPEARFLGPVAPESEPLTRAYASPERLGGAPSSVQDDIYALGNVLAELLGGAGVLGPARRRHAI